MFCFHCVDLVQQAGICLIQAGSNDDRIEILSVPGLNLHALLHHPQVVDLVKVVDLVGGSRDEDEVWLDGCRNLIVSNSLDRGRIQVQQANLRAAYNCQNRIDAEAIVVVLEISVLNEAVLFDLQFEFALCTEMIVEA